MPTMRLYLRSVSRLRLSLTASVVMVALLGIVHSATAAKIDLSGGGNQVRLEYQDATRRDVLNKVLDGRAIEIEWLDEDFAREQISGRLVGSFASVLTKLLQNSSFVIVYDGAAESRKISQIFLLGPQKGDIVSAGMKALEVAFAADGPPASTPEEKLSRLTKHQIDAIAISSSEYVRRLDDQNAWQQGGQQAYSDQMLRSAIGNKLANRLLGRKNASAGLPPLYLRPEPADPGRFSSEATALTTRMALRNLHSLVNALESVGKGPTGN